MNDNKHRKFLELINGLLKENISGITYTDISKKFEETYEDDFTCHDKEAILQDKSYNESMRKALNHIGRILPEKYSVRLVREGSDRGGYRYSYPEGFNGIDDWLKETSLKEYKLRLKQLLKLIDKSQGLIPASWMVGLTSQLEQIKEVGDYKKFISFHNNENLKNLNLLPVFYNSIEKREALSILYNVAYRKECKIKFSPYYLVEYNNRWFCLGHCVKSDGISVPEYICAIDRIVEINKSGDKYIEPAPGKDYSLYFDDMVGVTRENGNDGKPKEKQEVLIETLNLYTHGRIITKPLHSSQQEVEKFDEKTGVGKVKINVIPNKELVSLLMSFGVAIKVVEPQSLATQIATTARRLVDIYHGEK